MTRAGMRGAMAFAALLFADGMVIGGAVMRREWFAAACWAVTAVFLALSLWFRLQVIASLAVIGMLDEMRSRWSMREIERATREGKLP